MATEDISKEYIIDANLPFDLILEKYGNKFENDIEAYYCLPQMIIKRGNHYFMVEVPTNTNDATINYGIERITMPNGDTVDVPTSMIKNTKK